MGVANPPADPANVVQALVYTLLDVFDASRDLHQTLRAKEKRDYEQNLRSRGYPSGRLIDYVDEEDSRGDESLVLDKAAVTRQFEVGFQTVGAQFAIGDVITQTTLQSQIITLQSVIITTFLYGPTSPDPISHHLSSLVAASRVSGAAAVDALAAQQQRQVAVMPPTLRPTRSLSVRGAEAPVPPYPVTTVPTKSSASTALVSYGHGRQEEETRLYPAKTTILSRPSSRHERQEDDTRSYPATTTVLSRPSSRHERHEDDSRSYPAKTTILDRPTMDRTDTESTSFSGPTAYGTESAPQTSFCLYALDLQRHRDQQLSASITSDPSPYCPYCKRSLSLSPGKSWEVSLDHEGVERCFRIQNRFVVKCHRNSVDGGYSCVLCSQSASVETVCGDVKALIRHIWMDHDVRELKNEEDVVEVIDNAGSRRRDSGFSSGHRSNSRRSLSLGPSRGKGRSRYDKDGESLAIRRSHREV